LGTIQFGLYIFYATPTILIGYPLIIIIIIVIP